MDLTEKIKVKYSFSSKAEILDRQSEELRQYQIYFEKGILPEIKEIVKRKMKGQRAGLSNQCFIVKKSVKWIK